MGLKNRLWRHNRDYGQTEHCTYTNSVAQFPASWKNLSSIYRGCKVLCVLLCSCSRFQRTCSNRRFLARLLRLAASFGRVHLQKQTHERNNFNTLAYENIYREKGMYTARRECNWGGNSVAVHVMWCPSMDNIENFSHGCESRKQTLATCPSESGTTRYLRTTIGEGT